MRNRVRAERLRARDRRIDDQVAVGHQQRILSLVTLAGPDKWFDEAVPDRRSTVDRNVAGDAEFVRTRLDVPTFLRIDAAGVGKHGVHGPAALFQIRHAETRVEAAGKGKDDVLCRGLGAEG
jgi:hypothetical protein